MWIEQFSDSQIRDVHALMIQEWWCKDRSLEDVRALISGSSIALAAIDQNQQISAFVRVLSDGVFKAVVFDVIVRSDCRASGLGQSLMERVKHHPLLSSVKSIELYCPDSIAGFYNKQGFMNSDSKLLYFKNTE